MTALTALTATAAVGAAVPFASAAAPAPPTVTQVLSGSASTASLGLPIWTPASQDLVLVAVASQAWRKLAVSVTGNGLVFDRVGQVRNAQGIEQLDVFRAQGASTSGKLSVSAPGNAGALDAVALRLAGAAAGTNGAAALRALAMAPGPTQAAGDNADMRTTVGSAPGDLALGFGTNRQRHFVAPSGQRSAASDVAAGVDGQRIALSAWSAPVVGSATVVGAVGDLGGADDWAMLGLSVKSSGAISPTASPTATASPTTPATPTASAAPTATASASPTATVAPSATSSPVASGFRPYGNLSPWNTPIASGAATSPSSADLVRAISDNGLPLTSDVDQYTIPVYPYDSTTPLRTVKMSGYFSTYDNGDNSRVGYGSAPTITGVPIPAGVASGVGSDGQIVFLDQATGTEYSFWQFGQDSSGGYVATNGFRTHTTSLYNGRFADGLAGRGAGMPYLAGLVRKYEVDQGHIDHALAFAYHAPSPDFVYPASKSDGGNFGGVRGVDIPEGSRLQLNPALTQADLVAYGLSPKAVVIARALQRYGMYVVDNSGSSKVYLEDRRTAGWDSSVGRSLLSGIPWSQFRVLA